MPARRQFVNSRLWILGSGLWALALARLSLASVPVLPADQIRPGMKGYGLSVFSGTRVEQFGVEVIDVMHKAWPRGDMILCRLSGQGLEESGIIAGMSGSPVYIDGRLVGAVAYGWGFSKQPIAGVTPITQMLDVWEHADAGPGSLRPGIRTSPDGFSRLSLPVAVSGLTPGFAAIASAALGEFGLAPVAAAGHSAAADTVPLVPGSAVGVALVDGDVQFSAIGTLTHRDGNRILAFGHPMFQAGRVNLPMVGGIIHTVLPSVASSFKLFSPGAEVGAVTEDRLPGIGGVIGVTAPMIPLNVSVASATANDIYRCRVIDQEQLTSVLSSLALADIIYQTEGAMEEATLTSRMTVRFRAGPGDAAQPESVIIRHRIASANPAEDLFRKTRMELEAMLANRYSPARIAAVDFDIAFERGIGIAYLVSALADREVVRPGETVKVSLRLRDYRGSMSDTTLGFAVPPTAPAGSLSVLIAPRDTFYMQEMGRAPAVLQPRSLSALARLLAETGSENELLVVGFSGTRGLVTGATELPVPPPSVRSVLGDGGYDGPIQSTMSSLLFRQVARFDRIISGSARLEFEVRR